MNYRLPSFLLVMILLVTTLGVPVTTVFSQVSSLTDTGSLPGGDMPTLEDVQLTDSGMTYSPESSAFLKNEGQWDQDIMYSGRAGGMSVRFLNDGLSYALGREIEHPSGDGGEFEKEEEEYEVLVWNTTLLNANKVQVTASDERPGTTHFLTGNDPDRWVRNTPEASELFYYNAYKGIDLKYYLVEGNLKYDVIVAPGADIDAVQFRYDGVKYLSLTDNGDLAIELPWGTITDAAPISYQMINGRKYDVAVKYMLLDDFTVGFAIGDGFDPKYQLIIDPLVLYWSTFMGATGQNVSNYAYDIATDDGGYSYITGHADDSYPTTPGVYQGSNRGDFDAYVSKLLLDGTDVAYTTFVGGAGEDRGYSLVVNIAGEAFVTGWTLSTDFPTTAGVFQPAYGGGVARDVFVFRLNQDGTDLIYSTYLGGVGNEEGYGIAINDNNEAFVTGYVYGSDFPTTPGAFDTQWNNFSVDAFVSRLNALGTALMYSTYIGGSGDDIATQIAINQRDEAFITGWTDSRNFPVSPGAFQTTFQGGDADVFVTKLNSAGSTLRYSTYLGGADRDLLGLGFFGGGGINVNARDEAFIIGTTYSQNFPVTPGVLQPSLNSALFQGDSFITKLNNIGNNLVYSTYLGGRNDDIGIGIVVNDQDEAFITIITSSPDLPVTPGAFQPVYGGGYDLFVAHLSADARTFACGGSTYFGGSRNDYWSPHIALDSSGILHVNGTTHSDDFPIRDRFGITGPSADVYRSTKPNSGDWDEPFIFTMRLDCSAICGNGTPDPGEQCDDGPLGSDQCTDTCERTFCGDGTIQNPNGQGTGGPNDDGNEQCDDGNSIPSDGCTTCAFDHPLDVSWGALSATCVAPEAIRVNWETLSERDTLGFRVEWSVAQTGPFTPVSPGIPAHGPYQPYTWLDTPQDASPQSPTPRALNWYRVVEFTSNGPGDVSPAFTTATVCVPQPPLPCGGLANRPCPEGYRCEYPRPGEGSDDGFGTCVPSQ